jgi:ABC-type multidrug transport system ATPase subunit
VTKQARDLDKWMSYVGQEDVFHPTSTVKEVVLFHAHLR